MKDGVHLLGGMGGAILVLALYIACWGALQKCFGAEVKRVAPDGANTITLEVDDNGYVMGEKSTALYVAPKYIPQSGDKVVVDDFEYIMVSVGDWTRWTNAVARLEAVAERRWKKEHETVEGRRAWHGSHTNRIVTASAVTWLYPDGYTYTEEVKPTRNAAPAVRRMKQKIEASKPKSASPNALPPRLEAKRKSIENRPKTKTVNATFGPGGKVLKVEESK